MILLKLRCHRQTPGDAIGVVATIVLVVIIKNTDRPFEMIGLLVITAQLNPAQ